MPLAHLKPWSTWVLFNRPNAKAGSHSTPIISWLSYNKNSMTLKPKRLPQARRYRYYHREYLNPSFLVTKPTGGHRLVTTFADVGRYSKPQPSLLPDVDSTFRTIAQWRYIIVTDLTSAFYQIPLSKDSIKYCGVSTPFRGIRAYTRCAMGMPGSENALEELMSRVLGDCLQDGIAAKLADDLYCGADSLEDLLENWRRVLHALHKCNLRLSPSKTVICPKSTTVLGWIWTQGSLSASPHRLTTLSSCPPPETVRGLRSFIVACIESCSTQMCSYHRPPRRCNLWPTICQ